MARPSAAPLAEVHLQLCIQFAADQSRHLVARGVLQEAGQVQVGDVQTAVGCAGLGKRRGLRVGIESAAVELEGQFRLNFHVALRGKAAEKRNAQRQVAKFMLGANGLIVEIGLAASNLNVVHGKARRLRLGLFRRGRQALEDVLEVVAAVLVSHHLHLRALDGHRIHHRRQPQDGLQFGIQIETADVDLGMASVGAGNAQIVHSELQRPRLEAHLPDGDLTTQFLAGDLRDLALEERRHRNPGNRPDCQKNSQGYDRASDPLVIF
jgi:hypothetical protein